MEPKLKKFNANPWNVRTGDCVIRALVLGLGFDYVAACKRLKVAYKKGKGLLRDTGIELEDVKNKFSEFFDIIQDFEEDQDFVPDEFKGSEDQRAIDSLEAQLDNSGTYGITLDEFIDIYADTGSYLVSLLSNDGKRLGHIVFVNCSKGRNFVVDTFNSLGFIVDCFMKIKKTLPKDSPEHYQLDPVTKNFVIKQ